MAKILELGKNGVFHRKQEGLLMTRELDNNRFVPYPFRVLGGSADEINSVGDSVEVSENTPRLDFKKKYVPPTDNSFYNFDGVNDKIALPNPTGSVVVNPFSVAIKFKTGSDISTAQVIYSNVFDSSNRFSLAINNGYFVFSTYDGTFNDKSYVVDADSEYIFTVTKDETNTQKEIYLNGVLVSAVSVVAISGGTVLGQHIGQSTLGSSFFSGDVYFNETYNLELTAQEVLDRFNGLPIPDKYKGANNSNVVVNGDFSTDTVWFKDSEWTIGGGVASCDGTQAGGTNIIQKNILEIGKMYKITYEVKTVSAGGVRILCGATAGVFRTSIGVYTDYLICSSTTWLYFNADPDFIGSVDSISSNTAGNTLDLSAGKTAATWYDLDHDITGAVTGAILNDSTDFGSNVHETETCPVLLTEPAFTNLFINSRVPFTQTITTVIGVTYIFNCKGVGIGTYEEVGGNGRGGAFTEVNSSPYTATATSVTVTLVGGHSFDWVQMTDTEYPMNHVETLGVSVTKAKDQVNSAGDVNTFDSTAGILEIEMQALFNSLTHRRVSISDGTINNRVTIGYNVSTNSITFSVVVGGVGVYTYIESVTDITSTSILKLKYAASDFGSKIDGLEVDSQLSGITFPSNTLTSCQLDQGDGGGNLFARTKTIKTYKGIESY